MTKDEQQSHVNEILGVLEWGYTDRRRKVEECVRKLVHDSEDAVQAKLLPLLELRSHYDLGHDFSILKLYYSDGHYWGVYRDAGESGPGYLSSGKAYTFFEAYDDATKRIEESK